MKKGDKVKVVNRDWFGNPVQLFLRGPRPKGTHSPLVPPYTEVTLLQDVWVGFNAETWRFVNVAHPEHGTCTVLAKHIVGIFG